MADNSTIIDSIGLEITTDGEKAISGIDRVITALVNLQMIIEGMHNEIKPIVQLSDAIHKLSTSKIPATLPSRIAEIANATKGIDTSAVDRIADIADKMETVGTGIGTGGADTLDASFKEVQTTVDATASSLGGIQDEMANVGLGTSKVAENLSEATEEAVRLQRALSQANTGTIFPMSNAMLMPKNAMQEYVDSVAEQRKLAIGQLRDVQAQLSVGPQSKVMDVVDMNSAMQGFRDFKAVPIQARPDWEILRESINKVGIQLDIDRKAADEFGNSMKKSVVSPVIIGGLKKIGGGLKSVLDHTVGAKSGFGKLLHSIKRIATYRAIRAALKAITQGFKEGVNNLYEWSNAFDSTREFANSMDRIATALQYVKNSLGAMVAPIINYLAPAIDYLADKFVMLLNIVNEFFAAMTGASTYTVARKVAKQFKEVEKGASGAAKAVRSFTIGIDELNIIEDTGGGGGGYGGGSAVGEDWFEKKEVGETMKGIADTVKQAVEDINFAVDWIKTPEGWQAFKESVIESTAAVGAFFTAWPLGLKVMEWVGNKGADIIEGLVEGWHKFTEGVKWVGEKGADLIEGMVNTWNLLGDAIRNVGENVVNGVVRKLKKVKDTMKEIGRIISNFLTGKSNKSDGNRHRLSDLISGDKGENETQLRSRASELVAFTANSIKESMDNVRPGNGIAPWFLKYADIEMVKIGNYGKRIGENFVNSEVNGVNAGQSKLRLAISNTAKSASSAVASSDVLAQFKKGGEYMVTGIIQGLDSKKGQLYNSMKKVVDDTYKEFAKRGKISSPSKLFAEGGKWLVLGVNKGIEDNAKTTVTTIDKWFDRFGGIKPTVDTSGMSIPSIGDMIGTVQGSISTSGRMVVDGATNGLEEFLVDTLMPVVSQISDDAKRQADKSETITIDGRKLTDTVNRQNRTNGYSFT